MSEQQHVKIINDPVYGFVSIPYNLLFTLIEHPWFQRLRRIKQVSLSDYVYPGAIHTRFHHALGALHLTQQAISVLRSKGVAISEEEALGLCVAILLHDIGHGPFSHTLEGALLPVSHEQLSLWFMEALNEQLDGHLSLAIQIFKGTYHRPFLHQLVSGQLDMDRMDYLSRDSFFTGVYEGVIGYDRIIKMLAVHDEELVVEEKGIYSVEKFLIARRLMYWQVYLHKTVLSAEQMLRRIFLRARALRQEVTTPLAGVSPHLDFFLRQQLSKKDFAQRPDELLAHFAQLDDHDVMAAVKAFVQAQDPILAFLAKRLLNRKLFRLKLQHSPIAQQQIDNLRRKAASCFTTLGSLAPEYLVFSGTESNSAYSTARDEIRIKMKGGRVAPLSAVADYGIAPTIVTKHYLCYPKELEDFSS